jgi:hypothetical protein
MLISTDKAIVPYLVIVLFINAAKVPQNSDLTKFLPIFYQQKNIFYYLCTRIKQESITNQKTMR